MYNNIGKLIGFYHKREFDTSKNPKYAQSNFIIFNGRRICSQSKLSSIENGKPKNPYAEEYHYLINNLDFRAMDYFSVENVYNDYLYRLLNCVQFESNMQLEFLYQEFESLLHGYREYFYLHELNEVIVLTFNLIKGISLPTDLQFEFYMDSYNCYSIELQCLIMNFAYLFVENYNPNRSAREKVNELIMNSQICEPLVDILKATLYLRTGNFIKTDEILSSIKKSELSNYLTFKIERLQFMMRSELVTHQTQLMQIQNPSDKYNEINLFERSRTHLHLATLYFSFKEFDLAFTFYKESILINPEIACVSFIYVFDCLYELNRLNELDKFEAISSIHLNRFTQLHAEVRSLCISLAKNHSPLNTRFMNSLFTNLSSLNRESPYVHIVRKHLLKYVARTHRYKLIYDFERIIEN